MNTFVLLTTGECFLNFILFFSIQCLLIPINDTCDIGIQTYDGILDTNYSNDFLKNSSPLWKTPEMFDVLKEKRSQSIIVLTDDEEVEIAKPQAVKQVC